MTHIRRLVFLIVVLMSLAVPNDLKAQNIERVSESLLREVMPEAETELVGGFHTEYSGFRFSLFFIAEYANMVTVSAVAVTLFLGGWLPPFPNWFPFLYVVPPVIWFVLKIFVFLYVFIWVRGTLPRFRFDQLMNYGWKVFLPVALANVMITAGILLIV